EPASRRRAGFRHDGAAARRDPARVPAKGTRGNQGRRGGAAPAVAPPPATASRPDARTRTDALGAVREGAAFAGAILAFTERGPRMTPIRAPRRVPATGASCLVVERVLEGEKPGAPVLCVMRAGHGVVVQQHVNEPVVDRQP